MKGLYREGGGRKDVLKGAALVFSCRDDLEAELYKIHDVHCYLKMYKNV